MAACQIKKVLVPVGIHMYEISSLLPAPFDVIDIKVSVSSLEDWFII